MQRYVEQLIEDIKTATSMAPDDPFEEDELDEMEALEMELEEAERFVSGPQEKLADILGIPKNLLPAPERLNNDQKKSLNTVLIPLLKAFNFYPELPENLSEELIYKALYDIWNHEHVYMSSGHYYIEFCNYDEKDCPFPGFCDYCKENKLKEENPAENEFNIRASDLKGEENNIDQDFKQIEKEYYKNTEITDDEGFVPGIHNYCDRWCERCDFTEKCRVFEMEEEMKQMLLNQNKKDKNEATEDESDISDRGLSEINEDLEIEFDFDEEFGEDFDPDEEDPDDFFSAYQKSNRHPMIEMASDYSKKSNIWFVMRDKTLNKTFTAQLARGYSDDLMEAQDILRWYHMFIYVKLKRALSGYYELDEYEDADYDMNGSAKVALVAIDKSIESATILHRHLKDQREQIKIFRDQLEKIRLMAEEQFPDARSFIRPGLDEI